MFTDFGGQQIQEGDFVAVPNGKFRSGRSLKRVQIDKIIPLVPDPNMPGANYHVRADKARHANRRKYPIRDADKQYVAMVILGTYRGTNERASVDPSNLVRVP